tara:strand:+ start:527 stop:1075 length:549 start_codon:yes stop_codon:yes gene_type:complete
LDNLVWKFSLPTHNKIKSRILDIIDNYEQVNPCKDAVTKTDFYDDICFAPNENEYYNIFHKEAESLYRAVTDHYWVSGFGILNVWFQQYHISDTHNWHNHGQSNISLSYLLELDDPKHSTEFIDTKRKKTFQVDDVCEGDVIIFPSHTLHRSPIITSNNRKTSIAINLSLGFPDSIKIDSLS